MGGRGVIGRRKRNVIGVLPLHDTSMLFSQYLRLGELDAELSQEVCIRHE